MSPLRCLSVQTKAFSLALPLLRPPNSPHGVFTPCPPCRSSSSESNALPPPPFIRAGRRLGRAASPIAGSSVDHVGSWDNTENQGPFHVYLEETCNDEDKEGPCFLAEMKGRLYGCLRSSAK